MGNEEDRQEVCNEAANRKFQEERSRESEFDIADYGDFDRDGKWSSRRRDRLIECAIATEGGSGRTKNISETVESVGWTQSLDKNLAPTKRLPKNKIA